MLELFTTTTPGDMVVVLVGDVVADEVSCVACGPCECNLEWVFRLLVELKRLLQTSHW